MKATLGCIINNLRTCALQQLSYCENTFFIFVLRIFFLIFIIMLLIVVRRRTVHDNFFALIFVQKRDSAVDLLSFKRGVDRKLWMMDIYNCLGAMFDFATCLDGSRVGGRSWVGGMNQEKGVGSTFHRIWDVVGQSAYTRRLLA